MKLSLPEAQVQIHQGRDVAGEMQQANSERTATKCLRKLAANYIRKAFAPHLTHHTNKQRCHHLEGVIRQKLRSQPALEVTMADIVALVDALRKKSVNLAKPVSTAFSEILTDGLALHVVTANHCAAI